MPPAHPLLQPDKLRHLLQQQGIVESFQTLVELCPQLAIFVVDKDRMVLLWSRGAEELLGFAAEEVLGQLCLKAKRCASCVAGCGIATEGHVDDVPLVLYRADGQPIAVRKTARGFFDQDGEFQGGIEVLVPDERAEPPPYPTIPPDTVQFQGMLSRSAAMLRTFEIVRSVAATDVTVLIRGASGTGKELIARAIHAESRRSKGPFVAVNCAAFTSTLLESALFGHVKGAFTGAVSAHRGLFAQADGGTLFLDEVAELSLELQAKLLRVLQERSMVPVGGTKMRDIDVRIVSATNRSLRKMAQEGSFREDLMYRIRVVPLFLPPLRERREDIEALLWHFVKERNQRGQRSIQQISPDAMRAMLDYPWPGNIRELQNAIDYAFAVGRGAELQLRDLPPEIQLPTTQDHMVPTHDHQRSIQTNALTNAPTTPAMPAQASLASPPALTAPLSEIERIKLALQQTQGHNTRAAELLGISRVTLWRKRQKYGI